MNGSPEGRIYDVVVVGSGPAGSMTAIGLAKKGADVLLVDKARFPRPKVCGCCVNPRALEALRAVGLGDLTGRLGAIPLTSLVLGRSDKLATIRQPLGVSVSRDAFDLALVNAAREHGAEFQSGTAALLLPASSPEYRDLRLSIDGQSRTVRARFVVSATGLVDSLRDGEGANHSIIRSKIGAGAIAPVVPDGYDRGRIFMACGDEGYVGLVTLEDGRLDIAAALQPSAVRQAGGIGPMVGRILAGSPFPTVPGVEDLDWKGTPGLTRTARTLAKDRVYRVGDAAGYVEPFTGEGIAWALSGGARLATVLAGSLGSADREPERRWAEAYRGEVTRTQLVCRASRFTLRHPRMTGTMVGILAVFPGLAGPFIRSIHQRSPEGLDLICPP